MKISSNVVLAILKELQNPSQTFASVGARYNVSPTTVASIFDKSINIPWAKLPAILSTDENYAFYSKTEDSRYVCFIIDQQDGRPIDILPGRRYEYLDKYYAVIPEYEKKDVRYVVTDMYEPYRRIFKKHLPHAIHVVAHYHIAQELHRRMDSIRLRISNALMEKRNGIIKLITKAANGYTNWERVRNRCMLVLEKGITFEINKKDGSVRVTAKKEPDS